MASIIDTLETAARATELADLLRKHDILAGERAALERKIATTWQRQSQTEAAVEHVLTQRLSSLARRKLITMMVPSWEDGQMLDVLSTVRLTDKRAWVVTLQALVESEVLPIVNATSGAEMVTRLVERPRAHRVRHQGRERCPGCKSAWAEDIWRDRLCRICASCGRSTRTRIPVLSGCRQETLW